MATSDADMAGAGRSGSKTSAGRQQSSLLTGRPRRKMSPMGASLELGTWPEDMNMLEPTINCLFFFRKLPALKFVADEFEKHLWPCYRFNSCMSGGYWEQRHQEMDRSYHFTELQLDSEEAIIEWSQKAMFTTVDHNYPPWKCTYIHVHSGRSAMFWQVHHSIGDGLGLLFAMQPVMGVEGGDLLAKIPLPSALLPKEKQKAPAQPKKSGGGGGGNKGGGGGGCCRCLKTPTDFCKGALVPALLGYDTELKINPPLADRTPYLKFNGNRVFTRFPNVPMSTIKTIKDQQGCSVNDVLMAALTGALRRYGAEVRKDPLLSDDSGTQRIEFKTMVMIALPRPLDVNDLPGSLANKVLFATTPLPIGQPTALGRLEATIAGFDSLKSRPYMAGLITLTDVVAGMAPRNLLRKTASEMFSKHTLLVTNVPCTTCPISLPKEGGEQLDEMHMVFPNCISQVSLITYNGQVNANIVADPALFPEPERLAQFWQEEYAKLVEATRASE